MSKKIAIISMVFNLLLVLLLAYFIHSIRSTNSSKQKCPACKCRWQANAPEAKPRKPRLKKVKIRPAKKLPKPIIQRNADSRFVGWLEECKKESRHSFVNLLACVRWLKLKKYLAIDLADRAMMVRRKIGHLVLDRIGKALCEKKTGNRKNDYFITKELSAVYKNMRNNLRQLKNIKRRNPDLKLPSMKMCVLKDGKLTWDYP